MNRISNQWVIMFVLALAVMAMLVSFSNAGNLGVIHLNNSIVASDLNSTNSATDNFVATYDESSGGFTWTAGGGGGGGVHPVDVSSDVTGVLAAANGGTDNSVPTDNAVLLGDGAGWVKETIPDCGAATWMRLQYVSGSNDITCETDLIDSVDIANNSIASIDILDDTIAATDVVTGGITTVEILDATILEVDLNVDDTPVDGELLAYKTGGNFTWEPPGAGGGTVALGRLEDDSAAPSLSLPLGWHINTISTRTYSSGTIAYFPFYTHTEIGVDAVAAEITSAGSGGSLARACIYETDDNYIPGALVADLGTFAIDAIAVVTSTFSEATLPAGNYMLALVSNATVTYRAPRGSSPLIGAMNPALTGNLFLQQIAIPGHSGDVAGGCNDPARTPDSYTYNNVGFYMPLFMRISTP